MNGNGNQVATIKRIRTLADELKAPAAMERIGEAIQDTMSAERMVGIALTAASRNPTLAKCSTASIALALMQAGSYGIEPNGRDGHLVPYFNRRTGAHDCQFIPDYKGLIRLAMANPKVRSIASECVYSNDEFDVSYGSDSHLNHRPCFADRGTFVAVWAMAKLANGAEAFRVLTAAEVARHRAKAQADNVWRDWFDSMACKTAVKALAKFLPLGGSFDAAIAHDDATTIDVASAEAPASGGRRRSARRRSAALASDAVAALNKTDAGERPLPPDPDFDAPPLTAAADPATVPDGISEQYADRPDVGTSGDRPKAGDGPATREQLTAIDTLRRSHKLHGKTVNAMCRRLVGVDRVDDLTEAGATAVLAELRAMSQTEPPGGPDDPEPAANARRLAFTAEQSAEIQAVVDRGDITFDEYTPFKRDAEKRFASDPAMTVDQACHDLKLRLMAEGDGRPCRGDQLSAMEGLLDRLGDHRAAYVEKAKADYDGRAPSDLTIAQADHFIEVLKASAKASPRRGRVDTSSTDPGSIDELF